MRVAISFFHNPGKLAICGNIKVVLKNILVPFGTYFPYFAKIEVLIELQFYTFSCDFLKVSTSENYTELNRASPVLGTYIVKFH